MTNLYIQASIYNSGGDVLFNAVRLILEKAYGKENVYSCHQSEYKIKDKRPYHLVQVNKPSLKLAEASTKIFSTIRPIDEIKKEVEQNIDKDWEEFLWWKQKDNAITFNYWQIQTLLPVVVAITANEMGLLEKVENEVTNIANEVK